MGEMWTNAEAGGGHNNKNRTKSKRKRILRFGYEREPHENVERVEKATLHTTNGFVEHFCSSPSIFHLPMYGWIVHMIRLRQKYNAHTIWIYICKWDILLCLFRCIFLSRVFGGEDDLFFDAHWEYTVYIDFAQRMKSSITSHMLRLIGRCITLSFSFEPCA